MVFSLFLLTKKTKNTKENTTETMKPKTLAENSLDLSLSHKKEVGDKAIVSTVIASAIIPQYLKNIRPKQAKLIHGHEHVTRRWKELSFVVASGGVRMALILTREILADKGDVTHISFLVVNRSEAEIQCYQA